MQPALGLNPRDDYGFQPILVFDGEGRPITLPLTDETNTAETTGRRESAARCAAFTPDR